MKLTVGRIVHVVEDNLENTCLAAIVTAVEPDLVNVTIFAPSGSMIDVAHRQTISHDSDMWHDPRECPNVV